MCNKLRNAAILIILAVMSSGCASKYEPRESIVAEAKAAEKQKRPAPQTVMERSAYEKGVQDVLMDMKGKMRARDRFTWEAPMVQCGTMIPGRTINGVIQPAHEECVQIAPGRFIEEAPTLLPSALGAN